MRPYGVFDRDGHCLEAHEIIEDAEAAVLERMKVTVSLHPMFTYTTSGLVLRSQHAEQPVRDDTLPIMYVAWEKPPPHYITHLAVPWKTRYEP